jgi:predicted permease
MTSYSSLNLLARLADGVRPEHVGLALSTAPPRPVGDTGNPVPATGLRVVAEDLTTALTAGQRPMAVGVLAAGLLILFACAANVANLALTRGAYRTREFAAREALGATRLDIARLVLAELGVLTLLGIAGGLAAARAALGLVEGVIPAEYVTLGAATVSSRVAAFAGVAGLVVMLAGLIPAWLAWRVTPANLFDQTTGRDSRRARWLRLTMTGAQAAVAMLLIVAATFVGRSYFSMVGQDPGYDEDLLVVSMRFPFSLEDDALLQSSRELLDRLGRLPGVRAAGAMHGGLVGGAGGGRPDPETTIDGEPVSVVVRQVSEGFFSTTASRLLEGRVPRADEHERMIVVSASAATACCRSGSAIGRTLRTRERSYQVVGVIGDALTEDFDDAAPPTVFVPLDRNMGFPVLNYFLRTDRMDPAMVESIEAEILALSPQARISAVSTMRERLMASIADRTFGALMVGFFTLAGVVVSAAGLTGTVGFVVARRTREIAIRRAIGAPAANIRWVVVSEAILAASVGAGIGLLVGGLTSGVLESLLFAVRPADPLTLGLAALGMVAVVAGAAAIPAQRALGVSPVDALRSE